MDPNTNKMMTGAAGGAPPPEIISFTGTAYYGDAYTPPVGSWITFSWDTENADTVSISPDVGILTATTGITTHYISNPGYAWNQTYGKTYTITASTDAASDTASISFSCTIRCTGRYFRDKCYGGSEIPDCRG